MSSLDVITDAIRALSMETPAEQGLHLPEGASLPSLRSLRSLMEHVRGALFPRFFGSEVSVHVGSIYALLKEQVANGLALDAEHRTENMSKSAEEISLLFLQRLPEIKRLLLTDVEAVVHNDPAVDNPAEALFCYPVILEMTYYRTAHELLRLGVPMLPRIITELAHSDTGIDIHPAAQIGEYFAIDHGTGVVIGETTVIGNHVTLYQGVTLGAKNFQYDDEGHPMNIPRHPIVEDNVTIYSNTSVLGRIRIGHDSVIGGNVWLTHDVPPFSRIMQGKFSAEQSSKN